MVDPPSWPDKVRMPDYRRIHVDGGVYFFTVATYGRRLLFKEEAAVDALKNSFKRVMAVYPFEIDAMVVLPDHLHCIWTLPDGDSDFSLRWRLVKSGFTHYGPVTSAEAACDSRLRKKEKGIWQRRFWEHMIRDEADLNRHRDYIHYNPVKHGLTASPGQWKHSSFRKFVEKGLYPSNWGQSPQKQLLEMDLE
jgi:putative transposase